MPFQAVLDQPAFDALGEEHKAFYVPVQGKQGSYKLDLVGTDNLPEVQGLKTTATTLLDEKKQAEARARAYEDLGVKPEEIAEIQAKRAEAEENALTTQKQWETLKGNLTTAHERKVGDLAREHAAKIEEINRGHQERADFLTRELRRNMITNAAVQAIKEVDPEASIKLLLPQVESALEFFEEGEGDAKKFEVRVVGNDRQPRWKDGTSMMGIKDLINELRDDPELGGAFSASAKGGSGAKGGVKPNGQRAAVASKSELKTSKDKSAFITEHGMQAYLELPA